MQTLINNRLFTDLFQDELILKSRSKDVGLISVDRFLDLYSFLKLERKTDLYKSILLKKMIVLHSVT